MTVWKTPPDVAALNRHGRDTLMSHLGIEFIEVEANFLRARMPVDARTLQPHGLLHGGALAGIAKSPA